MLQLRIKPWVMCEVLLILPHAVASPDPSPPLNTLPCYPAELGEQKARDGG